MLARQVATKIRPDHLDRLAVIYVRQSTLFQVRENTGSALRQYDLVKRAQDLGWTVPSIQVIDQDQGHSAASAVDRDGFQWLVAEVGLGHVGAVFSLEVSRLARSCSDWYRLLEICALTDTLVIDEESIYDPGWHNDRLLLGFKGSMSEAELHWLKSRLLGGKVAKAEQGALRFRLPIGLVYDPVGRIVLDPDEAVQEAVRLVFSLFEQFGSALSVVMYFAHQHLRFPTRWWGGRQADELIWGRLTHGRVLNILHSPLYAGAYAYGRTQLFLSMIKGATFESKRGQLYPVYTTMIISNGGQLTPKSEKHLAGANEKGGHLLSDQRNQGVAGSTGVAQTVPESSPRLCGGLPCAVACPPSAAARTAFPTPDAG